MFKRLFQTASKSPVFRSRSYATYNRFQRQTVDWNRRLQYGASFAVVGGIIYVSNLEAAPISGRRRFMIVPRSIERAIGESSYREIMAQYGNNLLPESHPQHRRVVKVIKRLIESSDGFPKDIDWRVHVVHDPKQPPNAFVLPNGKVFVFTSIIPLCEDDDGLATVLAHETGHQLARHSAEQLSQRPIYIALAIMLYSVTNSAELNSVIMNMLMELPASREMEREADYIGLMLMSKACYDPNKAVGFWERMEAYEKQMGGAGQLAKVEWLSTHPASRNRVAKIQQWLGEANALRDQSNCTTSQYSEFMDLWK